MSSPPPTNPLKRPSLSSSASQPAAAAAAAGGFHPNPKRARMHPLRQTSFPSTMDLDASRGPARAYSDAGSVTGSFTGSLGGTSADGVFLTAKGKKRGRKSKAEKERERELRAEEGSLRAGMMMDRLGSVDAEGASVRAGGGGGAGGGGAGGGDDADEDDDFDDEGELLGREEGTTDTEAEKKNLALLVDAFNPLQSERYDLFKRAKLRKETLRRIVNHALSQSVPASVVTTINGFTKVFAGEIIEKARTVQAEWAEAHDQAALAAAAVAAAASSSTATTTPPTTNHYPGVVKPQGMIDRGGPLLTTTSAKNEMKAKLPPNPHRGQLLPAHLREALRRYKRDGEGGGVGFSGLSMGNLGVRGSVTWAAGSVGGRRIFR